MTNIIFQPSGKTIDVPYGTGLLEAARQAEITLESPCGGQGTCGKCLTRIIYGNVESDNRLALACQTKVLDEPLTVEITEQTGIKGGQFIDETDDTCLIRRDLFPKEWQPNPLARKLVLEVPPPQLADGHSDLDRLLHTLHRQVERKEIHFPLPIIRQTAEALRQEGENGKVTLTIAETPTMHYVIRIEPGDQSARHFGLAVDIGTTTVAVQLV
ncbi:MAG TPA: 2Fe-2S iron-sulfur cluster-binding protein, partial [Candidatus Deferrimicrobium sp.]|nr:2Fe-2S iron-sulfur cluster-binding protein [Candidatus Deferrimicrobium sp.]